MREALTAGPQQAAKATPPAVALAAANVTRSVGDTSYRRDRSPGVAASAAPGEVRRCLKMAPGGGYLGLIFEILFP